MSDILSAGSADSSLTSQLRPTLDDAAFTGLAGDVVRAIAPYSEADEVALLLHFLTMFGNAAGNGPHVRHAGVHPARLFVLVVGDSAEARKGTAGDIIEELFEQADPQWSESRIARGVQSAEALVRLVADEHVTDRRLMLFETEFGRLLDTVAARHTMTSALKVAYDGKPLEVTVKSAKRSLRSTKHHVSVIGHVQPSILVDKLSTVDRASGFANRFLYAVVRRRSLLPDADEGADQDQLDELADRLKGAIDSAWQLALDQSPDPISRWLHAFFNVQPKIEIKRTDAFRNRWHELYGEDVENPGPLNERAVGVLGEIIGRAATHVMRLAVTYALLDGAAALDVRHLDAAYAVWRYCRDSAETIFGTMTGDRNVDRIIRELVRVPDHSITRTDIYVLFNRHLSQRQVDQLCLDLMSSGLVVQTRQTTGGRPKLVYTLTPAAQAELTAPTK